MKVTKANFVPWNEKMFLKYNNERLYLHTNPLVSFIENKRVRVIINLLKSKKSDRILSAGCGEGYLSKKIPKGIVYAVDISKEAINRARISIKRKQKTYFGNFDLLDLPYRTDFFDKIECSEVIEHVLDPKVLVNNLTKILRLKGLLIFSFPNEELINSFKRVLIRLRVFKLLLKNIPEDMSSQWHLRKMNFPIFCNLINSHLKIKKIIKIPFWFLPLRYIVLCQKVA